MSSFSRLSLPLVLAASVACSDPPTTDVTQPDDTGTSSDVALDADADVSPDTDTASDTDTSSELPPCPEGDTPAILAIEGELTHETTLRIEGCRFGLKAQPQPRLYDSVDNQPAYEGLEPGDRIPTESDDAPWTQNSDNWSEFVRLATEDPRPGRTAFYRASGGTNGGDGALGWPRALGGSSPPADQRLLYVSWWYRPSMDPGGGDPPGANKFIRVWDDPSGEGTRISWTHMHIGYEGGEYAGWRSWTNDGKIGEWNRMEITIDAERGTIRHYVNGVYQEVSYSAVGAFEIDDFQKHPDYDHVGLTVGVLGFDHGLTSYGEMVTDFGDIYIDTTRARVEIGDAPTWSETRHREVQPPSAWDDDALEVTLQAGSFETLSGRYLYVIDAEGNVNEEGFAL